MEKTFNNFTIEGAKMKRKIGLWIDHSKAVIVSITGDLEEIKSIPSDMEEHVRFSGGAQKTTEEDIRDRRFTNHLNKYYDEVIMMIRDAESILIIGPGEAKIEFKKRLEAGKQNGHVINIETAGKMTDPQIAAKVRGYYSN